MKLVFVIVLLLVGLILLLYANRRRTTSSGHPPTVIESVANNIVAAAAKAVHPSSSSPVKLEHGWKTERVIATRRRNETMGQFVELSYPKNPNDCDRAEISDFIEDRDGWVFQGGGEPGASMFVRFKNVKDAAEMDRKLLNILPDLDKLMRSITYGIPIPKSNVKRKIIDKYGNEWQCIPPDPADPYGEFNNNMNVNGIPFKCSAEGRWIVDQQAQEWLYKYVQAKRELVAAISTRKLSKDEIRRLEPRINTFPNEPYFACDKYADLYELLAKQWEFQMGERLPLFQPLSRARGEYNRCPQEYYNEIAVTRLIKELQDRAGGPQ